MAHDASVPVLLVTYEELLERRHRYRMAITEDNEVNEGRINDACDPDGSVVDRLTASGGSQNDSRHGILQLKPAQREAMDKERRQEGGSGRRRAKNRTDSWREPINHCRFGEQGSKEGVVGKSSHNPLVAVGGRERREGIADVRLEWSSKESVLENLLSRWKGSLLKPDRIVHAWYVVHMHVISCTPLSSSTQSLAGTV